MAIRLGEGTAWSVHAVGLVLVIVVAIGWLVALPATERQTSGLALGAVAFGALVILGGIVVGRGGDPGRRERSWELEAVGVAVLAIGWLWTVAG